MSDHIPGREHLEKTLSRLPWDSMNLSLKRSFGYWRVFRRYGIEPPVQVMERLYQFLDQHAARLAKTEENNLTPEWDAYCEIYERFCAGETQEQVILEVAIRLRKEIDSFKPKYFQWKRKYMISPLEKERHGG